MEYLNYNVGDEIWYFSILSDDYYGRLTSGISELKHAIINKTYDNLSYHDLCIRHYILNNGEEITELGSNIYNNEDIAIKNYNNEVNKQISQYNEHIDNLIGLRKDLEKQLINEKAL